MKKKNKYVEGSHLSEAKFRNLLKCFVLDLDAQKASVMTVINRNTVNKYYKLLRLRIIAKTKNN